MSCNRELVSGKGQVRILAGRSGHEREEPAGAPAAECRAPGSLPEQPKSRGLSDDAVEGFGGGDVGDADRDVVDIAAVT